MQNPTTTPTGARLAQAEARAASPATPPPPAAPPRAALFAHDQGPAAAPQYPVAWLDVGNFAALREVAGTAKKRPRPPVEVPPPPLPAAKKRAPAELERQPSCGWSRVVAALPDAWLPERRR